MKYPAMVLCGLLCAQTAAAQSCDLFDQFVSGSAIPRLNGVPATCATSKVLGEGASTDCYWVFDYRVAEVQLSFQQMSDALATCADNGAATQSGGVNHPDSFDQLMGEIDGHIVSLSLKDKGALGQTLIFLRKTQP